MISFAVKRALFCKAVFPGNVSTSSRSVVKSQRRPHAVHHEYNMRSGLVGMKAHTYPLDLERRDQRMRAGNICSSAELEAK
jgi:hypothetical protein